MTRLTFLYNAKELNRYDVGDKLAEIYGFKEEGSELKLRAQKVIMFDCDSIDGLVFDLEGSVPSEETIFSKAKEAKLGLEKPKENGLIGVSGNYFITALKQYRLLKKTKPKSPKSKPLKAYDVQVIIPTLPKRKHQLTPQRID